MLTENVSTLKIHKLTQEQYDRELAAGNIDESALYLTPDEEIDLTPYATKDDLSKKADTGHTHDDRYYTETEIDAKVDELNSSIEKITGGTTTVKIAEHALLSDSATTSLDAEKLGGQNPSYYARTSDIPTGTLAEKDVVSESELDSDLVEKINVAFGGNHNHSNKTVLDGVTSAKVSAWDNAEANANAHTDEIASGKADKNHTHDDRYYTEAEIDSKIGSINSTISSHNHDSKYDAKGTAEAQAKVVDDKLIAHTDDTDIHVTTTNKSNWNTAYTHSQSTHARTDATKVADSTTNGNILINGTETNVYTHPNSGVIAGTYKSITVNAQGHITGGTNPTTLSGYGITDAESKGAASSALASAKEYTDSVASTKANTSHNHDSAYDAKGSASSALASAKSYADSAATTAANKVKNDLLNGAGAAYDTLSELGNLIDDNVDAIEALEAVAANKSDKGHIHSFSEVSGLQSALDGKAATSHGTHVSYSTTAPVMDGTASVGSASTVARSDHKHPSDTSRASKTEFDSHTGDTTKHITSTERSNWNAAKSHADSAHAPSNAQANQNAFSNVKVGSTTIAADTTTDTLELVGSNVTITPDATNDKVTIAVADGSTSTKGIVQLTNSTSSTSTTTAATPSSVKSAYDLANTAKTAAANAQATADGKANASHTHNYAGSSSVGGAATSANKVNSSLTVKLNGGSTEGTNLFTFNGSAAKSINITPSSIGAAASSHTHDDRYYTESEVDSKLSGKANSSHGNHVPATQTANNAKFLRNDNTWQTVTPANIGAATSGHTHTDALYTVATDSSEEFVKVCTLKTKWGSNDTVSVKFDFTDIDQKFTEVVAWISCTQEKKYTYSINANGDYAKAYAYVYADGILEVWVRARTYSSTRIYPKSNYSRNGIVTWDFEKATALPTDAIEYKQAVASEWSGNATSANRIIDYGNQSIPIQVGYQGSGISSDKLLYIAGYMSDNGIKIKDVSKGTLQSWLGLGSAAYTASTAYATSGHTHNYAGSSSAGGSATSAVKLDTATAGSATQPAYFSGGKPVACTYTLGKSVPSDAKFTDTTYSAATQSAQGLMSAADKKKLDGIATGANAYSLPTASSSTLGGVKTTSTVTSTSGLTACPIISGVPYYKDTNTTYSLSSFGITATAAELNYTDGVTSNIQTQLNGKAASSHTHSYLPLSGGTVTGATTFNSTVKIGNATMSYDSTNKRLVISVA